MEEVQHAQAANDDGVVENVHELDRKEVMAHLAEKRYGDKTDVAVLAAIGKNKSLDSLFLCLVEILAARRPQRAKCHAL